MAPRVTVVVFLVMSLTACGPAARVVRLDTGRGAPLEYRPPAATKSVAVDAAAFEDALAHLVLDMPLTLRAPEQGWLVRASYPGDRSDLRSLRLMAKSFADLCNAGRRGASCPSEIDYMRLDEWDRLGIALAFSLEPMKASISKAVEKTLAPELFYGIIATGLITWVVLAASPEPVFTKAMAIVSAVMLAYLGIEMFLEVVEASRELKHSTDRATTVDQLDQAGQRFATRVGPQVARVFVLVITVAVTHGMVGGAAFMASRLTMLPSATEAEMIGASQVGLNLRNLGQVSAVTVSAANAITIVLAANAIAAVALGPGGGSNTAGEGVPGKSDHARQRQSEGRPVGTAFNDVTNARPADVFIQEGDGRVIVRAARGREHIFEQDGTLVTTVDGRSAAAHQRLLQTGSRRPATEGEFNAFKSLFRR